MAKIGVALVLLHTLCTASMAALSITEQRQMALKPFQKFCKWKKCANKIRCNFKAMLLPRDTSVSTEDSNFHLVITDFYEDELSCKFPDAPINTTDWRELTNLIEIQISGNDPGVLSGHFLPFLLQPPALLKLTVTETKFTGKLHLLPWQASGELQQVDVRSNALSGHLPSDLFKNKHVMTVFSAPNNAISGTIPNNFDMSQLTQLKLQNNRLTGPLPKNLRGDFMEDFRLSNNQLTGTLDFDGVMGKKSSNHGLTHLYLDGNKFSGALPQSLSKMTNLKMIHLQNNHFSGKIPHLETLTQLVKFGSHGNELAKDAEINFNGNVFDCPIPSTSVIYDSADCVCRAGYRCAADKPGKGTNFTVANKAPNPAFKAPYGWLRSPTHGRALPEGVANSGRFKCTQCSPGKFNGKIWNDVCADCDKGTFSDQSGTSQCAACGQGKYGDAGGAQSCKPCEQGRFNKLTKQTACKPCTAGQYQPDGLQTQCLKCDPGQFSAGMQAQKCDVCQPGFFAQGSGQPKCSACKPGTFAAGTMAKLCAPCDLGKFSSGYNSTSCINCATDRIKLPSGASKCGGCKAGNFLDATAGQCAACPAGTFRATPSVASSCSKCAAGKFSPKEHSTACSDCGIFSVGPPFFVPEVRSKCAPWYESWLALGVEGGIVLIFLIVGFCICCVKRRQAHLAAKRAKLSHKLLTLRDYDTSDGRDEYDANRGGYVHADDNTKLSDEDETGYPTDEWERRENHGEVWYFNTRTHAATLERPDGYQSDEGNDEIPDAPTTDDTTDSSPTHSRSQGNHMRLSLKYDFVAAEDDGQQLSASKSETVTLVQKFDDGWWKVRNQSMKEGLVPASYCNILAQADDETLTM